MGISFSFAHTTYVPPAETMKRQNNVPFIPSAVPKRAASGYDQMPLPGRVPQHFIEAMRRIPLMAADNPEVRTSDMAAKTPPAQRGAAKSSAGKWKSSFKPIDDEDDSSQDKSASDSERTGLYDPDSPLSSDCDPETPQAQDLNHSPPSQDNKLERQRLSPGIGCHKDRHWDSSYSESGSQPPDRHEFSSVTRPAENRGLSPGHRLPKRRAYSPDAEPLNRQGYGSRTGPLDQRGCSPDRLIHDSSTQRFPARYGEQRVNGEERITLPEYRREMTTTVRLSPPRLQRDYQHQKAYVDTGLDRNPPTTELSRNKSKPVIRDKDSITCDLCEVELANGKELEDHLESKCHWDTLEHIQQNNNYDDLVIAFLQEVMLHKSQQCSRAIENSALQALQENDHMTKVEMFHCAACKVFISTSAAEVQTHITSLEHLSNTKEFEVQQRRACLSKAEAIMKELKPQFEHFLKGGTPFERQKILKV